MNYPPFVVATENYLKLFYYRLQGKVIFSEAFVCPHGGGSASEGGMSASKEGGCLPPKRGGMSASKGGGPVCL